MDRRGRQKHVLNLLQVNNEKKGKDGGIWTQDDLQQTQKCPQQRGTHLLDGVVKFDVVLCDFTVEVLLLCRDVLKAIA